MGNLGSILLKGEPWWSMFAEDFVKFDSLAELVVKFLFNFVFAFIIIRLIYFPRNKNTEYLFTFFIFNTIIFFVTFLLYGLKLKMGFAFGLFAVFSILRYRTEQIPIREMTFMFISISLAVINALSTKLTGAELLFANVAIVVVTYLLEKIWARSHYGYKIITYEKVELIRPENRAELLADLEERTGLKIQNIDIQKIDYLQDTALIKVSYYASE